MQVKKGTKQKGNNCIICGSEMSSTTAARASHMRKHVRDGSMSESKDKNGKCKWEATGKEPKDPQEKKDFFRTRTLRTQKHEPRKQKIAKSKNNKVYIKCRKCNKFKKSRKFGDDRFIMIKCDPCDAISLFPQRMVETLLKNPNKEYVE